MEQFQSYLLWIFFIGVIMLALFSWRQPRAIFNIGRWANFIVAGEETPDGFYTRLYHELKNRLNERQLPFSAVGFGPQYLFSTRTIFGSRPVYLALRYQDLTYYVYAAPAPGGLFVSSWLFSKYTAWEDHPILKWVLSWKLYHQTLFQADITDMFHGIAHGALMEVVDDYREEQGLQPLEEHERRPVLQSYYARMKQGTNALGGAVLPVNSAASLNIGVPASASFPKPVATPTPQSGESVH